MLFMANEAVLVHEYELPVNFIVSNTVGIEKGALLKMADPMTASSANGTNDTIAGIAAQEKIASNGQTHLGVYRRGIFRMYLSGAATVGDPVGSIATYTNFIASNRATTNLSGSPILGTALETGTNGEQILVELNITPVTSNL